jgi:membrane protease YdiL (CAAX protease family)
MNSLFAKRNRDLKVCASQMHDTHLAERDGETVMTIKSLPFFFLIAFGLAWGIMGLYIFDSERMIAAFGPVSGHHPLFVLSVYSPAIAALCVVAWAAGVNGVIGFLSRLLLWRCSRGWYAFILLGIPLIYYAGSLVKGNLSDGPFPFSGVGEMLTAMAFMLFLGPVEELGWRGVALPLLQRHMAPIWAGLLLGSIWGIWHLPAFFLSGTPQNAWDFTPFLIGSVAVSLILTALFNNSRGSILLPALFHFQLNNPLWPDAQPYDTYFFVLAAVVAVWINRDAMFSSKHSIKNVLAGSGC